MTGQTTATPSTGTPAPRAWRRWRGRIQVGRAQFVGAIAGVVLALVALGVARAVWPGAGAAEGGRSAAGSGAPAAAAGVSAQWQRPTVSAAGIVDRIGAKITQVAVTGQGGLIDLRFQVVDPDRAAVIHDPTTPPALVDEKTGLVVNELLMNHAHSGAFNAGETYYLVFENPGNWVDHGSSVTVLLGNAQVEHVVVS